MKSEENLYALSLAAPFPPVALMRRVSGLTNEQDFAQHGRDFFVALSKASPKSLLAFQSILDFGVGPGRLARMFKDYHGSYCGADVDHELLDWVKGALPWVTPLATVPRMPLPCTDGQFDCVISISVFSHMNEQDANFYLQELHRITRPGAILLLTIHGQRALDRALTELKILDMLAISRDAASHSSAVLSSGGFSFVLQQGHLTSEIYEYGMTFISDVYVRAEWSKYFVIEKIVPAGIYDFQDIVVLRRQ